MEGKGGGERREENVRRKVQMLGKEGKGREESVEGSG